MECNEERTQQGRMPFKWPLGKRFHLLNDGDLWQDIYQRMKAKGHSAVRASWVKGHATQDHINVGKATLFTKIGNDESNKKHTSKTDFSTQVFFIFEGHLYTQGG